MHHAIRTMPDAPATVATPGFADQTPGTSGLRRQRERFLAPHYIENFVQAILEELAWPPGAPVAVGRDPREGNGQALARSLAVLAGNGHRRVLAEPGQILTTPSLSLAVRDRGCVAGLMFTASHNPPADLGLKLMLAGGGQAPGEVNRRIGARAARLRAYQSARPDPPDESRSMIGAHLDQLESLFDFDRIAALLRKRIFHFDAMHGAGGPAALRLFGDRLGVPIERLHGIDPRPDLGGCAPDPSPASLASLLARRADQPTPLLLAACDGDADRNFLHTARQLIQPGDSLAVLADNLHLLPGYRDGLTGLARTFPTSRAVDRVAARREVPLYVTASGWRHFVPLIEAGSVTVCGEEAYGTSSRHLPEKDGLWAICAWLNLLATTGLEADELLARHWQRYGRDHVRRQDFAGLDGEQLGRVIERCEELAAADRLPPPPLDGTARLGRVAFSPQAASSAQAGWEIRVGDAARIVCRPSGTAASGETLRLYVELHRPAGASSGVADALASLQRYAAEVLELRRRIGCVSPPG